MWKEKVKPLIRLFIVLFKSNNPSFISHNHSPFSSPGSVTLFFIPVFLSSSRLCLICRSLPLSNIHCLFLSTLACLSSCLLPVFFISFHQFRLVAGRLTDLQVLLISCLERKKKKPTHTLAALPRLSGCVNSFEFLPVCVSHFID